MKTLKEIADGEIQTDSECEKIILECVPGGNVCDPQTVADNIRDFFKNRANKQMKEKHNV